MFAFYLFTIFFIQLIGEHHCFRLSYRNGLSIGNSNELSGGALIDTSNKENPIKQYASQKILEIKELSDLAHKKLAQQSSKHSDNEADRAVDGNKNQDFFAGSCSHTAENTKERSWLSVDLDKVYLISRVQLFLRSDCCLDRNEGIQVFVSNESNVDEAEKKGILCGTVAKGSETVINCPFPTLGRFVTMRHKNPQILTICEVYVHGRDPCDLCHSDAICRSSETELEKMCICGGNLEGDGFEKCNPKVMNVPRLMGLPEGDDGTVDYSKVRQYISLKIKETTLLNELSKDKTAFMSSIHRDHVASRVVDGNQNQILDKKSCMHTSDVIKEKSWLIIDLGRNYVINEIKTYLRKDCCLERNSGIDIYVSKSGSIRSLDTDATSCGVTPNNASELIVECPALTYGRYVVYYHPDPQILTICESIVSGYDPCDLCDVNASCDPSETNIESICVCMEGYKGDGFQSCLHASEVPVGTVVVVSGASALVFGAAVSLAGCRNSSCDSDTEA